MDDEPKVTMREAPAQSAPVQRAHKRALPFGQFEIVTSKREADGTEHRVVLVCSEDLTPEEEMDMSLGIPVERIVNPVWMQWARLAASIKSIDGDPIALPHTEAEVRAIIKRVGPTGMRAVERTWSMQYAAAIQEVKRLAKKSRGT
mgnify:CR=1 FL=1